MAALSTSYEVETLPKNITLVSDISDSASSMIISYVPLAMTKGILLLDEGQDNEERVSFGGVTDNGNGTATLTDCTRGLPYYSNALTGSASRAYTHTGNACTVRLVVAHELLNLKGNTDRVNTWLLKQTFSVPFQGPVYASLAALQAAIPSPSNGEQSAYCTAEGQIYDGVGGAWTARASGVNPNGSTTVAGKFEKATDTEGDAGTELGATGASLVFGADSAVVVRRNRWRFTDWSEKTIASDAITVTAPLHTVDTESDAATDNLATITAAYGSGEIIVLKAEHTDRTVVIKHGSGNIRLADATDFSLDDTDKSITLIRQGSTWYELSRARGAAVDLYSSKVVYLNKTASSSIGTSSSSDAGFDTHTYDIPANTLVDGVEFVVEGTAAITWAAGTSLLGLALDGTNHISPTLTPGASGTSNFKCTITGTTTAGASAAIIITMEVTHGTGSNAKTCSSIAEVNVATNQDLTITIRHQFGTSNGGNAAVLKRTKVTKQSTTPFA